MKKFCSAVLALVLAFSMVLPTVPALAADTQGQNLVSGAYLANRDPLVQTPFVSLPLGSIKADGWLYEQLRLQKEGLTGEAENIFGELGPNNGWRGGSNYSWEAAPYYVKGLIPLAYILDDASLKSKIQKWIDGPINSQITDPDSPDFGYMGPKAQEGDNSDAAQKANDWWPRMVVVQYLRDYYEAVDDQSEKDRVLTCMLNYFTYQNNHLDEINLRDWGKCRTADNIEVVLWAYNVTGEEYLLDLANKLYQQAYNWSDIYTNDKYFDFNDDLVSHGVNVGQAMKFPAVWYQVSKDDLDRNALDIALDHITKDYGHVDGGFSCTELLTDNTTTQGMEMCGIVEKMLSLEISMRIFGDASIGDELEKMAFNALPAGLSKDIHQVQYYQMPNQVMSTYGKHGYRNDYDNTLLPSAYPGVQCCVYNFHQGWPKYVQNMWMATQDNGLAAVAYGPSTVTAYVADKQEVTIKQETNYPFEDTLQFTITTGSDVQFPFKLRIPAWCENATVLVNGEAQTGVTADSFYIIDRTWKNGDTVTLTLPMTIRTTRWFNNSMGIERGPLAYALKIGEDWQKRTTNVTSNGKDFNEYEVLPTTDWNYGLIVDEADPDSSFTVETKEMPTQPFNQEETPVTLKVNAKKIPEWGLYQPDGMEPLAQEPPISPVTSTEPTEEVTLVPYGACNLRVSEFPVIGEGGTEVAGFSDDFTSETSEAWKTYGGEWTRADGTYSVKPDAGGKAIVKGQFFSDFTYEADVTLTEGGNGGLIFRVTSPAKGADAYKGYYVGLEQGRIFLGKTRDGWKEIATQSTPIQFNQTNHIKIIANGPDIRIYLNDMYSPILEVKDENESFGYIGLRTYNAGVIYDNIKVTTDTTVPTIPTLGDWQFNTKSDGTPSQDGEVLQDGATISDASGNEFAGRVTGGNLEYVSYDLSDREGIDARAVEAKGDAKILFSDQTELRDTKSNFSTWLRVQPTAYSSQDEYYMYVQGSYTIYRGANDHRLHVVVGGRDVLENKGPILENGKWYDLGFSFNGSSGGNCVVNVYFNGYCIKTDSNTYTLTGQDYLHLLGGPGSSNMAQAKLDRVTIYDSVLSIKYYQNLSNITSFDVMGDWDFTKEANGSAVTPGQNVDQVYDSSIFGTSPRLMGSATYEVAEDPGDRANFDGSIIDTSSCGKLWFQNIPTIASLDRNFTVWVRVMPTVDATVLPDTQNKQDQVYMYTQGAYTLYRGKDDNRLHLQVDGLGEILENGPVLENGTWYDIGLVFDGTNDAMTVHLYLDGEPLTLTPSFPCKTAISPLLGESYIAGAGGGGNDYRPSQSKFERVTIYKRPLSASEIYDKTHGASPYVFTSEASYDALSGKATIQVQNSSQSLQGGVVLAAAYDADHLMTAVQVLDLEALAPGAETTLEAPLGELASGSKIKVFIWKDLVNIIPLAEPAVVTL